MVCDVALPGWAGRVLRLDAALTAALGVLLILGTWDGLYFALDLPHLGPALLAQLGGAGLLGLAYLLWIAPRSPEMARAIALAVAVVNALGAVIIAAWLVVRSKEEMYIGTQGFLELVVATVVLAVLAAAQARIASGASSQAAGPAGPRQP
jgi:hypothetical protein